MKCYFTFDPDRQVKVLIPGCYGSLHHDDLSNCSCPEPGYGFYKDGNEKFNLKVAELNREIAELRQTVEILKTDNYALMRVLENLNERRNRKSSKQG